MQDVWHAVECDVLVIGGAGAGLAAAIEARSRGASVLVVTKDRAGRSGNTVVAGSQFAAVVPYPGSEDSPDRHFDDTLRGGKYVNDEDLVRILVERGGSQVLRLEEWGVKLQQSNGDLLRRLSPGHSWPRVIPTHNPSFPYSVGGLSITVPMRETAERMGVRFLDDAPVVRLAVHDGEVWGALALDTNTHGMVLVAARAVVVAAGGAGQLFSRTNNTRGITGGSYGLLLQAGATLRDMEFVQVYPSQMSDPFKLSVNSSLFADGASLRNRHGERFMLLYDPANGDMATRDTMSQAIFYEVQKGNGVDGGVYMDCSAVPESVLQAKYGVLTRDLRRQGVDPALDWLKVAPTVHFLMGGAVVDSNCFTGVPGLFAAGEAVGGVHGANRLSANALTEIIVFGAIAGEAAARYAGERRSFPRLSTSLPGTPGAGGESLNAVRETLRAAMWNGSSIVRSEASLLSTLAAVRECAEAVEDHGDASIVGLARREETRLMCLAAESIVRSALARRESRGAHYREDFPTLDDAWLGSNRVLLDDGEIKVEFVPKRKTERRGPSVVGEG